MKLEFEEVFKSELGAIKGLKAKLNLKEGTTPKCHKARREPYSVRPKIDPELQKLENYGIISKVDWSERATPVVAVPKAKGLIRLCGDFKVTINPELKIDQHPLPGIEDIFANLAAGHQDRPAPSILTTRNGRGVKEISYHQHARRSVSIQQTVVWRRLCTCNLAKNDRPDIAEYSRNTSDFGCHHNHGEYLPRALR